MKSVTRLPFGGFRTQVALFTGAHIEAMNISFLALRVKNVAIGRIEHNVETIAAGERDPIAVANSFFARDLTRSGEIFIVLQAAGDPIERLRVVERNSIKFARGNAIEMFPALAGRVALINAAIRSKNQALTDWRLRRFVFVFRLWRLRRRGTLFG